jgi:hypothetical protein
MSLFFSDRILFIALVTGIALRVSYILYVEPVWEDALITLRIVENFISNNSLSYNHPLPVYAFTSPLNALLIMCPAHALFQEGINAVRITSLFAFAATLLIAYQLAQTAPFRLSRIGLSIWLCLIVGYMPGIYFPMGGMETQFAILFTFAALQASLCEKDIRLGLISGIGLLVRPDTIIFTMCSLFLFALKNPKKSTKAALVCAIVYLPWFVFSWYYFGSPVPHSAMAKSLVIKPSISIENFWWILQKVFSPTTSSGAGSMTDIVANLTSTLAVLLIIASIWAIWKSAFSTAVKGSATIYSLRNKAILFCAPAYALSFVLYMFLSWAHAPWYHVPAFLIAAGLFAQGFDFVTVRQPKKLIKILLLIGILAPHIGYALVKPYRDKLVQQHIENEVRSKTGEWLKNNVPFGERVYLEALGYIGYYAGLNVTIIDWPGLASPVTLQNMKKMPPEQRHLTDLILPISPEWIVIRPQNYNIALERNDPTAKFLKTSYQMVANISVSDTAPSFFFLQNHMDANFIILKNTNK